LIFERLAEEKNVIFDFFFNAGTRMLLICLVV